MSYSHDVDYALYDFNQKQGMVPFLDDATARAALTTQLLYVTGRS